MPQKKTPVERGTRWGFLTVGRPITKNEASHVLWEVECDCGAKLRVWGYALVKGKRACRKTCDGKPPKEPDPVTQLSPEERRFRSRMDSLGLTVATRMKMDPTNIVKVFLYALEDANQHDMTREVVRAWKHLTGINLREEWP